MPDQFDAIIVGAGVIGTAIGYELARQGKRTLNIDALPEAGHGPTSGSCAIIRVHYSTLDGTAFAYDSYFYWKDWAGYLGAPANDDLAQFHECGCLVMQTDANDQMKRHTDLCQQLDIPFDIWGAAQIRDRLPIYNLDRFAPAKRQDQSGFGEPTGGTLGGAVYFPTAGYISDPKFATQNIQQAAERHGGNFRFNSEVTKVLKDAAGRVSGVELRDGSTVSAPVVVNCAGAFSSRLNAMAGALDDMTIQTKALRQEVVHVPSPAGFDFEHDGLVISDSDISCYCRPEKGNHILVGSEDPECDTLEIVDPASYSRDFTNQWTTQAMRMGQRIPTLGIPSRMRGVVDLYDMSDDWIPIYDKSSVPGYYMAIGTSGNQFKNAPGAGKMMATLIDACENGHDHDQDPVHYHLENIERQINVGFYSRKREINRESSFSVLG